MFSSFISLKVTVFLFVALLISGILNYTLYAKLETKNTLIAQQEQSIKSLNDSNELKDFVKATTDNIFKEVITDVKVSDNSYESLQSRLKLIDCKKTKALTITEVKKDENTIDPDVTAIYDIVQSAYNLQNKN